MKHRVNTTEKVINDNRDRIKAHRREIARTLLGNHATKSLVAIIGPCSLQNTTEHIQEGLRIMRLSGKLSNIIALQRAPTWKPRTNDKDWHGLDESDPEDALRLTAWAIRKGIGRAIEIRDTEHLERYQRLLSFGWIGSRNHQEAISRQKQLDISLASIVDLPVGVKNEMSGNIDSALERAEAIATMRLEMSDNPAPALLVFRGGKNITTPSQWHEAYLSAHKQTGGNLIVDTAHGSSIAHDHRSQKSNEGQTATLSSVLQIARESSLLPRGLMIEASNHHIVDPQRQTDPNLDLETTIAYMRDFEKILSK